MAASQTIPHNHEPDLTCQDQPKVAIEHLLECAVALNWKDFTRHGEATSVQVEYGTATNRSLECLKFWSSTKRGYWNLVCEHRAGSEIAHQNRTTFTSGNSSADLPWMLDAIMQHQNAFTPSPSEVSRGLIQVACPGQAELKAARKCMAEAMDRISLPSSLHVTREQGPQNAPDNKH